MTLAYLFGDDGVLSDHLAGALGEEVVGFEDDTAGGVPLTPTVQPLSVPPDTVAAEYLHRHRHNQTQTARAQPVSNKHMPSGTVVTENLFSRRHNTDTITHRLLL